MAVCWLEGLALPSDADRVVAGIDLVAGFVLDVTERAAKVRCASPRGDSLYNGEERARGEPR
jgi:hypothetical protein